MGARDTTGPGRCEARALYLPGFAAAGEGRGSLRRRGVGCDCALGRLGVRLTAPEAGLLVQVEDHPDRPPQGRLQLRDLTERLHDDDDAGAVVDRSLREIPGVEMRSEQDHLAGLLAA